jgi:hypothetical protein
MDYSNIIKTREDFSSENSEHRFCAPRNESYVCLLMFALLNDLCYSQRAVDIL